VRKHNKSIESKQYLVS